MDRPSAKYRLIHEVVSQEGSLQNVKDLKDLCRIAGVSRSGYYSWLASAEKRAERETRNEADFALILEAYRFREYDKGIRGIHMRLLHMQPPALMNTKKIQRFMRKYGVVCPIRGASPYRRMMKALKTDAVADNLLNREFKEHGPRRVLLTDITYIPYCGVFFFYLSVIKDACTMQILAYALSDSLAVDFVLETVNQLIEKHGASLYAETLIHSDQGSHYTSKRSGRYSVIPTSVSPCPTEETARTMRPRRAFSAI
ncbi:MAG: DDE-type integrase/transposase/recombinase [Oscillospiraceae bacterium]|nr:DDE-type integrase/transposase/recombinase [Oscillospiraceae bacterium]